MIVPIPAVTTTLASAGVTSSAIFNEFWPYALIVLGLFFGGLIVIWLYNILAGLFVKMFGSNQQKHDQIGYEAWQDFMARHK